MKMSTKLSYRTAVVLLSAFLFLSACKKHEARPDNGNGDTAGQPNRLSDADSLKFYVWWINESDSANVPLYYWYDQVPDNFQWWSGTYKTGSAMLTAMRSYAEVDGKKVDRYSFLDMSGAVAGELQGGEQTQGDYGFMVAAAQDSTGDYHLVVEYTYKGSPAGKAGVTRGDEIVAINDDSNLDITNQNNANRIDSALFASNSVKLKLQKPHSTSSFTVELDAAQYHINPVLLDTVYTVAGEKVGYFVYNSFISVTSSQNGVQAKSEIDAAFSKFKAAGIKDLIVDIRYNGGGSVDATEYLDNLIAPSAAVGQEMYKTLYNDKLTDAYNYLKANGDQTDKENAEAALNPINFSSEANNLNLSRVFFIVSHGTASAAELTINNLKPYMDVKLIGDTTYGKPVGFFGIPISFVTEDKGYDHVADMYAINFQSVNSKGAGDYYSGMAPDVFLYDYIGYNWGDTEDPRLASIFNYIEKGQFITQQEMDNAARQTNAQARRAGKSERYLRKTRKVHIQNPHQFNGMVDYRKEIKGLRKRGRF